MKKVSIIEEFKNFIEKQSKDESSFYDHLILGIEVSDGGVPLGIVTKLTGSPIMSLGMIDILLEKLQDAREEVLGQIKKIEEEVKQASHIVKSDDFKNFQKTFDRMSIDDKDFFNDIHKRIIQALIKKDEEEMRKIMNDVKEYGRKKFGIDFDPDSDFNLDDFKNGF